MSHSSSFADSTLIKNGRYAGLTAGDKALIKEVLRHFDFMEAARAFLSMGWTYGKSSHSFVPGPKFLKQSGRRLLIDVVRANLGSVAMGRLQAEYNREERFLRLMLIPISSEAYSE